MAANQDQLSTIGLLPREVLELIFNKLVQKDALNLRLVCQDWKMEVDQHYNWNICLDDRSPTSVFQQILQLRIKTCSVVSFMNPRTSIDPLIFKHPRAIRQLNLKHEVVRSWPFFPIIKTNIISVENLHSLLKSCCATLEDMCISFKLSVLSNPCHWDELMSYGFQNLQRLEISVYWGQYSELDISEDNLLHRLVGLPMFPHLRSLSVEMAFYAGRISFDVISFIAKHGKTLENVELEMFFDDEEASYAGLDVSLLKKANSLRTVNLELRTEEDSLFAAAWREFLNHQTKLEELLVDYYPVPSTVLQNVALENFETLTKIRIGLLTMPGRKFLNLSCLESCGNLKHLGLKSDQGRSGIDEQIIRLENLSRLPSQVEELDFSDMEISSADLIECIRTHKSLTNMRIYNSGDCEAGLDVGVNGSVLEEVLKESNSNLQQVNFGTFNSSAVGELDKLKFIFTANQHPWASVNSPDPQYHDDCSIELRRTTIGTWVIHDNVFLYTFST